jgi:hypothetical protein
LSKEVKELRDELVAGIEDRRFEIEQLIEGLARRSRRSEKIDKWIETLQATSDAIEYCGEDA